MTLGKFEKNAINEDAVCARKNMIAVSDGAGGGGLFADRWSRYLVSHLPHNPITTAEQLDEWIGSIWEAYYNKAEESAKKLGGMALDKFYDEGSFATLAVVWKQNLDGFRSGRFPLTKNSIVFVASDALSHYILMMYELSLREEFAPEIEKALSSNSKNSNLIAKAQSLPSIRFEKDVIDKLRKAVYDKTVFRRWAESLYSKGLLAMDDYSLAVMYDGRVKVKYNKGLS